MAKRGFFGRIADAYRSAKLEWEVAQGKKSWGRQNVNMKARATIQAVVIRADGTREDLGVLSDEFIELTPNQLNALERAAERK